MKNEQKHVLILVSLGCDFFFAGNMNFFGWKLVNWTTKIWQKSNPNHPTGKDKYPIPKRWNVNTWNTIPFFSEPLKSGVKHGEMIEICCHHIFFVATKRWKPFFQEKLKTLGFTCACATCTAAGLDAMGLGVFWRVCFWVSENVAIRIGA